MKKRTLTAKLFVFLFALLGFSRCGIFEEPVEMYGTPYATFEVKVKVKDENGKPIPNIRVSARVVESVTKAPLIPQGELTDTDGFLSAQGDFHPYDEAELKVYATDIDGELNGSFKKDSAAVKIVKEDYHGGKGFFAGKIEKEVNIVMKKKEE